MLCSSAPSCALRDAREGELRGGGVAVGDQPHLHARGQVPQQQLPQSFVDPSPVVVVRHGGGGFDQQNVSRGPLLNRLADNNWLVKDDEKGLKIGHTKCIEIEIETF